MSSPLTLRTDRLTLLAATQEMVSAERHSATQLSRALDAIVPYSWPHEGIDDSVLAMFERQLRNRSEEGWWLWYVILPHEEDEDATLIGTCGCVGRPDKRGAVEIGYGLLQEYQGSGYAIEAVAALVTWLWSHREVKLVWADILSTNQPSIKLLTKLGFHNHGASIAPGCVRMAQSRDDFIRGGSPHLPAR